MPKIFFSVGEASGDLYASIIIKELLKQNIDINNISAIGGHLMAQTGINICTNLRELQVFGFAEAIASYFQIKKILHQTKQFIKSIKPDIFVPVAFSGFNIPLIKFAKKQGLKVIYFAPPQVWAWGKFRVKSIKKYTDKVISLFPFEQKFYEQMGINAIYSGNPLIDYVKSELTKQQLTDRLGLNANQDWLSFMPGSRPSEINRHLPIMLKIIERLKQEYPEKYIYHILIDQNNYKQIEDVYFGKNYKYEIMAHSNLILLCSGTASLEATILGTPFISIYRLSPITYAIAKIFLKIPYFTLPNLITNKSIVQEFAQPKLNQLYNSIKLHISNDLMLNNVKNSLNIVKQELGSYGATSRIVQNILK